MTKEKVPAEPTRGGLAIRLGDGSTVPLTASPARWKRISGDPRSERAVRTDCEQHVLPTLPRAEGLGSRHRIAVAKALEALGVPFEIVTAAS